MIIGTLLSRKNIENGLFRALNLELAERDHFPDLSLIADKTAFDTAIAALKSGGNTIIGLKNVTTPDNKDNDHYNIINIERVGAYNGRYGKNIKFFVQQGEETPDENTLYDLHELKGRVHDVEYALRIITKDNDVDIAVNEVINTALEDRSYIKSYDDSWTEGQEFLVRYQGEVNVSGSDYIERIYTYMVYDVWEHDSKIIRQNVPSTKYIEMKMNDDVVGTIGDAPE